MYKKVTLIGVLIGLLLGLLVGALYYELYYCEKRINSKDKIIKNKNFDKASMLINKLGMLPFQISSDLNSLVDLNDEQKTNLVLCSMHKTIDEAEPFLIGCYFGTDYLIDDMKKAANSLFGDDDFLDCPYFYQSGKEKICTYGKGAFSFNSSFLYYYAKWLNFEEQSDYAILSGQFAIIEANLTEAQREEQIICAEEGDKDCVISKDNYKDIALYNLNYQELELDPLYQGDKKLTKNQVFNQFGDDIYIYKFFFKLKNDHYHLEKVEVIK